MTGSHGKSLDGGQPSDAQAAATTTTKNRTDTQASEVRMIPQTGYRTRNAWVRRARRVGK